MSRNACFRTGGYTCFLTNFSAWTAGKTPSTRSAWISTAIFILPARMPICFPLSIRPIYPDDVWKSRCCRCPLRSSLIFTALRLRRSRAHLAAKRRKRSIKMVRNMNCVRFLTPTCVLAVCPVLPTSAWNRIRR